MVAMIKDAADAAGAADAASVEGSGRMRGCFMGWKNCGMDGRPADVRGAAAGTAAGTAAVATAAWAAVTIAAWALAALLCLSAPARAFWGDYGPEPAPEIFGVRLGDDIRNYKGMVRVKSSDPSRGIVTYVRGSDEGIHFGGVPVKENSKDPGDGPGYETYKNKIYRITFSVAKEDYEETARGMVIPPKKSSILK